MKVTRKAFTTGARLTVDAILVLTNSIRQPPSSLKIPRQEVEGQNRKREREREREREFYQREREREGYTRDSGVCICNRKDKRFQIESGEEYTYFDDEFPFELCRRWHACLVAIDWLSEQHVWNKNK